MPSIVKTNGIILKIKDTPGKDKLLHILTENGLINAFITPKRNAGKKSYTFDIFSYGEIVLYQTDSGNYLVNSVTPSENFYSIREDIVALSAAGYFSTLAMHSAIDADTDIKSLISLLILSLTKLTEKVSVKKIKPAFEFKITQLLGFTPCLEADRKSNSYYFDFEDGRLYSSYTAGCAHVSRNAVYCIYKILGAEIENVFDFTVSEEEIDIFYNLAQCYLLYHTEREFESLNFLNGVM